MDIIKIQVVSNVQIDSRNMQYRVKEFITFSSAASQAVPEDRAEQTISKLL